MLRGALLDALKAEREAFTTCPDCGKRHPVIVPDWTARVKAVETLLNQGFGRQPERVEAPPANRFEKLTDEQLQFWGVVRVFEDVEEAALAPLEHEIERAKKRLPDRVNSSQGHEEFREATAELRVKKEQRRELVRRTLAELMHMDDATREHVGELVDSGALIEWLDEASR